MTTPKLITIRVAGLIQATGEQVGAIGPDGRASIISDGIIVTGWHIPKVSNATAPHPLFGNKREAREAVAPIVGGCDE